MLAVFGVNALGIILNLAVLITLEYRHRSAIN
jgi:hypothetical protein